MERRDQRGFTLLEILLVVAMLAILAGLAIFALDPATRLTDAANVQRQSDERTIFSAIQQHAIDNFGAFPSGIDTDTATVQILGTASSGCESTCGGINAASSCLDLSGDLVPTFIVDIPQDPTVGTDANTGYYVQRLANGRIVVQSCVLASGSGGGTPGGGGGGSSPSVLLLHFDGPDGISEFIDSSGRTAAVGNTSRSLLEYIETVKDNIF